MKRKLVMWVDDMRNPHSPEWKPVIMNHMRGLDDDPIIVWLKNYEEFIYWLKASYWDVDYVFPTLICFDHDLGEEKTGFDCVKFLVEFCDKNNIELPICTCHSSNPVGRENILSYINSYKKSLQ